MEFEQVQALVAEKAPPVEAPKEEVEEIEEVAEPEEEAAEPEEEELSEEEEAEIEEEVEEELAEAAEAEEEEVIKTDKGRMIPHSRYKEKETEAATAREQAIRLETELNMYRNAWQQMQQQQAAPVKEEANPYDPEFEKVEYLTWENQKLAKQFQAFQQSQTQLTTQQQQQQAVARTWQVARSMLEQASTDIPDLSAAYQHYITAKRKENTRLYGAEKSEEMTETTFLHLAAQAQMSNLTPLQFGRMIKELAIETTGYQQQKKKSSPDLEAIARNKKKSTSAGTGGSAAPVSGTMDVKKAMKPGGRGVDIDEAMKIIERIGKGK